MLRRTVTLGIIAGGLVLSLVGCGGGNSDNATASAPTTDAVSPTTDATPTTDAAPITPSQDYSTPAPETTTEAAPITTDDNSTPPDISAIADTAYVATVQGHSAMMALVTPDILINDGHLVCQALDNGASLAQVFLAAEGTGVSMSDAAFLDGAAIVAYCPQYKYLIPGQ